ncbi:HEPN/Toprim-associated domain-containing protein [Gallaecimonas xiamenensis]|uniref:HEPN/Toprim-associated domain-containing protein n=1 Tax=Gallaecimonas xiamenensis TaxID=1207039 RepID=UPI0004B5B4E7|nr:HEPN/Toprim-associated domain-containing protein [Gallaecimonas xiamenensis]
MSTFAGIEIGDYNITEWQNTYHQWLFVDTDRVRDVDGENIFIGFRADAGKIKRRLELIGINKDSVRLELEELKSTWIKDIKSLINLFNENEEISSQYCNYLNGLETSSIESWLKIIPIVKDRDCYKNEGYIHLSDDEKNLFEFINSDYDEYPNYTSGGYRFPCFSIESYAWLILQLTEDNTLCELDISALIDSGWVDDFDDIKEFQAGSTIFFDQAKKEIEEIVNLVSSDQNATILKRLVYGGLIGVLEAYLADVAKRQTLNKKAIKRRFVERFTLFNENKKKISVSEIYKTIEGIDRSIIECIDSLSFHNIKTIKSFYSSVLLIDFHDAVINQLSNAVSTRHDVVHRAGKTPEGEAIEITNQAINELSKLILSIMEFVDKKIIDGLLDSE